MSTIHTRQLSSQLLPSTVSLAATNTSEAPQLHPIRELSAFGSKLAAALPAPPLAVWRILSALPGYHIHFT